MNTKLSIAAGLLALILPGTALAYLSPSEIFGGQNLDLVQPPPYAREADTVVRERQATINRQRQLEQDKLSSTYDEDEDDFVPPEAPDTSCLDDACQFALRQERLKAAAGSQGGPTIIIGGNGGSTMVYDSQGNVLHSGAPLVTATGPGTVVAVMAAILALLSTLGFVWYRSRFAYGWSI